MSIIVLHTSMLLYLDTIIFGHRATTREATPILPIPVHTRPHHIIYICRHIVIIKYLCKEVQLNHIFSLL
jgi:hypothetical protein